MIKYMTEFVFLDNGRIKLIIMIKNNIIFIIHNNKLNTLLKSFIFYVNGILNGILNEILNDVNVVYLLLYIKR